MLTTGHTPFKSGVGREMSDRFEKLVESGVRVRYRSLFDRL